jgi:hypothetical protein
VTFFDSKPPEAEPEYDYTPEPWSGPPRGWLGGVVGARLLLARASEALAFVHGLEAFPDGLSLHVALRGLRASDRAGMDFHAITTPEWHAGVLAPAFFRFGAELSDRRRATNLFGRFQPPGASPSSVSGRSALSTRVVQSSTLRRSPQPPTARVRTWRAARELLRAPDWQPPCPAGYLVVGFSGR